MVHLILFICILTTLWLIYDFIAYESVSVAYKIYERLFDRWNYEVIYESDEHLEYNDVRYVVYEATNKFNGRTKIVKKKLK